MVDHNFHCASLGDASDHERLDGRDPAMYVA